MTDKLKTYLAPGVVALFFLGAGAAKLMGVPDMVNIFDNFHLPHWFMYVTAVVEIMGAIGLVMAKRTVGFWAALMLSVTMLVGAGFHFVYDPFERAVPALVLMAVCGFLAYRRRGLVSKPQTQGV